jgi:predicted PurR-regulated permease PerM
MGFGLLGTIKLIKDLGVLFEVSRPMVDGIQQLLTKKKRGLKETERVDDLEKAMSLQARLNEQYENQIKVVQSTLGNIERSLKVLAYALVGVVVLSAAAIVIAVLR